MKTTANDVMDFSRFFLGKDEPPYFYREYLNLSGKIFIPADDIKLAKKLNIDAEKNGILHYFIHDSRQNQLLQNPFSKQAGHQYFYAICSPDFSVDSANCFSCFNLSNILKARIIASLWQARGLSVILTLIWGNKSTYKYAFDNIEQGCPVAVSHQAVTNEEIFQDGILYAIQKINPEMICWYGSIPEYMADYYDIKKIIRMQTRAKLMRRLYKDSFYRDQPMLFPPSK